MSARMRRLARWFIAGAALLLFLLAIPVAVLAFPYPFFSHRSAFGEITIYTDGEPPAGLAGTVADARRRIEAMEHYDGPEPHRVFLCRSEGLYAFFARTTLLEPDTQGFAITWLGNTFLSDARIRKIREGSGPRFRHSRFEGNLAFTIAHEAAHGLMMEALGYSGVRRLPAWKAEGYADHQANLAATRGDPSYSFEARVGTLLEDAPWQGTRPFVRPFFKWHVLVEYLVEVRGFGLEELADESVTEEWALSELMNWYRGRRGGS